MTNHQIRKILVKKDKKLAAVLKIEPLFQLGQSKDPFVSLASSIIGQQLSGKAADAIEAKIIKLCGGKFPSAGKILKISDKKLRECGLSYSKISYLKDLASRVVKGELDLAKVDSMTDEEVVNHLTSVKGIGRWTAHMFLMFALGREDIWAVGDLGLRKAVSVVYNLKSLPDEKLMEKISAAWRPYRSIVALHLWASLETK